MRALDFRFNVGDTKIGAPFHGLKAFFTTEQLSLFDKVLFTNACLLAWRPSCIPSRRTKQQALHPPVGLWR